MLVIAIEITNTILPIRSWLKQVLLKVNQSFSFSSHVSAARHYFSKSRSRRSKVSVSSRHLHASENGHVSAIFKASFQN